MRVIGYRHQRTLATKTELPGVGFITGANVRVRFHPAPPNTGVVFHRTDLPDRPAVAAHISAVTNTQRRTTLGPPGRDITLVEHLLAALAGLRIDNCLVELDGPEPPGLDGSAAGFVQVLAAAGTEVQPARRPVRTVCTPMVVTASGSTLAFHPTTAPGLRVSYLLDYGFMAPIPWQAFTTEVTPEAFAGEIAPCRTFLTEPEAHELRAQGIGRHLTPADLLVFGRAGPIDNALRFANEPARHKVLDLLGDLALCGFDLAGHVVAYRSGHALNTELARRLAVAATMEPPGEATAPPPQPKRKQVA